MEERLREVLIEYADTKEVVKAFNVNDEYFLDRDCKIPVDKNRSFSEYVPTPYELFGIECGEGWRPLIKPIVDYVDTYNKEHADETPIELLQIKEKWGVLTVYTSYGTDELFRLIDEASDESSHVCEMCGSRESVGQTAGHIQTLCMDCVKKIIKERANGYTLYWKSNDNGKWYEINGNEVVEMKDEPDMP